ncbi:MAG: hypothetical protein EA423_02680 [Phycisphaerales bacterium]|nr:MAG: hypothetical protein EA423_02680 [Phycisphaerales bacterium]
MPGLLLFSSWFCLILVIAVLARTFIERRQELLSMRTFFLLGFAYFYLTAGILFAAGFGAAAPSEGQTLLALAQPFFLAVYFLGEKLGGLFTPATKFVPNVAMNPSTPGLLVTIGILVTISVASLIYTRGEFTAFGLIVFQVRGALAATAVGLATYLLLAKRFNPIAWSIFFGVLILGSAATLAGTSGRRGWLSVLLAIFWGWYYFRLRFHSTGTIAAKAAIPAAIGVFLLLGYSAVRHKADESTASSRLQQIAEIVRNPRINTRAMIANLNQDTPYNTVFIMDFYPDYYDKHVFAGAFYALVHPIPRGLWPEKPVGLGIEIEEQMGAQANLAPGIIGHGWAEAQWFGIFYYALFFGVFVRFLDEVVRRYIWNPYVIAVMGCTLGNIFALPRGDTPLFFVNVAFSYLFLFVLLYAIRVTLGPVFAGFQAIYPAGVHHHGTDDETGYSPEEAVSDYGPDPYSTDPYDTAREEPEPPSAPRPARSLWD